MSMIRFNCSKEKPLSQCKNDSSFDRTHSTLLQQGLSVTISLNSTDV